MHNIDRTYPYRDPPLTPAGHQATEQITLPTTPDLILISPMTRTIQTAINAFPFITLSASATKAHVQIWPELREAHDAICNKGLPRAEIEAKFPQLNFSACHEEWDYPAHSVEGATARAERVRERLMELSKVYNNIALITHRGFIAFLVQGERFDVCEMRSYRFGTDDEVEGNETLRFGANIDTMTRQDFGPTVLIPLHLHGSSNG